MKEELSIIIQSTNEKRIGQSLSASYMTDEEADDEGGFVSLKPSWRSELVQKPINRLDEHYEKNQGKEMGSGPQITGILSKPPKLWLVK